MRTIQTEVLVIGGGATGTGVARDLALRGFKTILVERRDLTDGTSGRYHGLLHSGARYAVRDPHAAKECIEENRTLRKIMPQCIEDTGGFFVLTPHDDPAYAPKFVEGCRTAGISCEEVPIAQMLREEPLLDPRITRCFRVPDGSADSFLAADLNAESARQHGAEILRYHPVVKLMATERRVVGAMCRDLVKDEDVEISADLVVNAAGAWCGKVAATAGVEIAMTPGKGTMLAVSHRVVNTVINRCKLPGDGDILVPAHTVAVIGTTDVKVADPDHFGIEPWEVRLMLDEGEKIIPNFRELRFLRAWAGVRPLYQETENPKGFQKPLGFEQNRDITRAFTLLDHEMRDGVAGMITITSGKWTTYRKMAEVTVDKVCEKLGTRRECRTHLEVLPSAVGGHSLGHRLAEIEHDYTYGQLICECELATREDIERAIVEGDAKTLDDVRRDARLGMGPCQGGFCTVRAAAMLHRLRHPPVEQTNVALRDFLQERWKGVLPVLWGQQLRQERLDELIYLNVLNVDHLPGPKEGRLSPEAYEATEDRRPKSESARPKAEGQQQPSTVSRQWSDVLVIGAGLSGLVTAWRAASKGKKVKVIAKGWGANHWGSGCVDVLGYYPPDSWRAVDSLAAALPKFIADHPQHPYALAGINHLDEALAAFRGLCAETDYPMHGSLEHNWLLPTAVGAVRPTCLAPEMMIEGDLHRRDPMLIVGFEQFLDFCSCLLTDNLNAQAIFATDVILDLPSLRQRKFVTGMVLARLFDTPEFRAEVVAALKPKLTNATRVGFPAVLGLKRPMEAKRDLETQLGRTVFEIPGLPPSVPGIRLHNLLIAAIEKAGGRVFDGMLVTGMTEDGHQPSRIGQVLSEAAARNVVHKAESFVLATGGLLGGGLIIGDNGYAHDTALGIPVKLPANRAEWFQRRFLASGGHPLFRAGIPVNSRFQPTGPEGRITYDNLFTVGGALANCDPIRERSLEGIALVTGFVTGERA